MSRHRIKKTAKQDRSPERPAPPEPAPEPVDVVDGIPDRSPRPSAWKYLALLAVFLGWVAVLIYFQVAGGLVQ